MPESVQIEIFNYIKTKHEKTETQQHINIPQFQRNKILQKNSKNKTDAENK